MNFSICDPQIDLALPRYRAYVGNMGSLIPDVERMLARCKGTSHGAQLRNTEMLARAKLIRVGKKGGTHPTFNQRTDDLAHFLLAESAPRKSAIAEHVRRHVDIVPTFKAGPQVDDAVISRILAALAIGDQSPRNGLIHGAALTLKATIERVIDCLSQSPDLGTLMEKARFELEVLEIPPLYVPQANFRMEHAGGRVSWNYSGAAQGGAHDGTDVPAYGPLIKSVRLGAGFFVGAGEIWAATQSSEKEEVAA